MIEDNEIENEAEENEQQGIELVGVDWLQLARETYSESKSYADTELRTRWDRSLRQWKGEHPEKSRYCQKDYRRSKLFRPKTRAVIRKNEAGAALAYLASQDVVSIKPANDNNQKDMVTAELANILLNQRLTKTIPWFHTVVGAYQTAQVYGEVISCQYWDTQKDAPCIDLIPPENFLISPAADWINPIATTPYIIHLMPMYVQDIKENEDWDDIADSELLAAANESYDSTRTTRENTDSKSNQNTIVTDYMVVWVRRYIVKKSGIDWVFHTLGEQKLLDKPMPLSEVYHTGNRPYAIGSCVIEAFKPRPIGVAELIADVQSEINSVTNQRMDNVRLAMDKRYFAKRNAQVDLRSITSNVAGSVTLMNDPVNDVIVHSTPDVTSSSFQEQDRLNLDFDDLAGSFSNATVQANRRLNETVGGMEMLSSGANQISEYQLKTFNETWVEPVLRQLVDLEMIYESDPELLDFAAQSLGVDQVDEWMFSGKYNLNVNVGTGASDPQNQVKNFFYGLQTLAGINPVLIQNINTEEVIKEVFGKLGYKDGKRFFNTDTNPEVEALQQQIQQLQAEIGKKNPELEAAEIELKQAQAVKILTEAQYSAMQGGSTVAQIPQVAPIADIIMTNAGYQTPQSADDPNYPFAQQPQPVPDMPVSSNIGAYEGIETNRVEDNV